MSGMRHTAVQLPKWPSLFNDFALRMNLFNLYIFIEIGGTGGGAFRAMYARFLDEAAAIAKKPAWAEGAEMFRESARRFSSIGQSFKDAVKMTGMKREFRLRLWSLERLPILRNGHGARCAGRSNGDDVPE